MHPSSPSNPSQPAVRVMTISKELAHVIDDANLFVNAIWKTGADEFETEFCVDGQHPYLYENPAIANHVSGTSFLDASRQLLKAMSHLYYDIPLENRFVIQNIQMDFLRWAKIGEPIRAIVEATAHERMLGGVPSTSFIGKLTFFQVGRQIGTIAGKFSTLSAAVEERLMSRQYRQPPPCESAIAA
jgi:hypothetical protein